MQVALRAKVESSTVIAAARETLHSLDPDIPVGKVSTLASIVDDSMTQTRFSMMLMAAFGVLAVVLASIGMYGVVSYSVMQRTREIGIRIALGAERRDVFRMVIAQGARLGGLGIAIGLAGALAATRLIANQLYGVQTTDPLTFAAVAILLIIVVLLACYVPARRAMRVEPTAAVRYE
jgi:putative ABC transport system permease protein